MIAQRRKARRKTQPAYQMYIQSKHTYTTHIIDKRTNQHAGTMAAPQSKGNTPQHAQRKGRSLQQCYVGSVWCVAICVAGVTWVHETGRPSRWIATPGRDAWLHYVNERSVPVGLRETQRRRCRECCVYTYTHIAWHLLAHSTIAPSFNDEALRRGQTPASRNATFAFIIRHTHTRTHKTECCTVSANNHDYIRTSARPENISMCLRSIGWRNYLKCVSVVFVCVRDKRNFVVCQKVEVNLIKWCLYG